MHDGSLGAWQTPSNGLGARLSTDPVAGLPMDLRSVSTSALWVKAFFRERQESRKVRALSHAEGARVARLVQAVHTANAPVRALETEEFGSTRETEEILGSYCCVAWVTAVVQGPTWPWMRCDDDRIFPLKSPKRSGSTAQQLALQRQQFKNWYSTSCMSTRLRKSCLAQRKLQRSARRTPSPPLRWSKRRTVRSASVSSLASKYW